jgi:NAD(P)-dependent dehydrogenase (short-subunit alcohol dehydrogenase family)
VGQYEQGEILQGYSGGVVAALEGMALDEKVILVSGVGPGLGSAVARQVLASGGRVVLGDQDGDRPRRTLEDWLTTDRVVTVEADIRLPSACEQLVAAARSAFGRLDGLVHVAALDRPVGGLLDGDLDDWTAVAEVNVKGTLQLTKLAVPLLCDSGGGSIVMVGSIAAAEPVEGVVQLAYGMSKAALAAGAYYLSRELGPLGIRVNTIAPGWKWGPALEDGMAAMAREAGTTPETLLAPVRDRISLRRFATDRDVANSILFLLSDAAGAITGQTVYVDGGICH